MPTPTQSLYAVDPRSQKVRLVMQISPEGWESDLDIEAALGSVIPILDSADISVALLVSSDSTFIVRRADKSRQFEVDEIATSEALAPLPMPDAPAALAASVETWVRRVAEDWQQFVPDTSLPKRLPEIVPLIVGSELRVRDGAIGLPEPGSSSESGHRARA